MATRRKIGAVSGSRADYGHMLWILRDVLDDPELELSLIVTGSHFADQFGRTVTAIEQDAIPIAARVVPSHAGNDRVSACRVMGEVITGVAEALERLRPDILLVLGDRYEILAATQAAVLLEVPIAHLHGGEVSAGAFDDSIRNAITKLAHLHFVAADVYRDRIIGMGEMPERVFTVGAPGLDWFRRLRLMDRNALSKSLDLTLDDPVFILTYHPVTLRDWGTDTIAAQEIVAALESFSDAKVIITGVNADPGYAEIRSIFEQFAARYKNRVRSIESLGQLRYLSLMKVAAAVIGNSSSGIIEAPAAGVPSINIGSRQRGRARAPSVLDCDERRADISHAINTALSDNFRRHIAGQTQAYGSQDASRKVKEILKRVPLRDLIRKDADWLSSMHL